MVTYDPERNNYSGETIEAPDGTTFFHANFTQALPWTEPFSGASYIFKDCNLTNCIIPADAEIRKGQNNVLRTVKELADGRQWVRMFEWIIEEQEVEVEPGVFVTYDVQVMYRVEGDPLTSVRDGAVHVKLLGPTGP